ncbi:CGNR zinc finger domain-containing protein [Psychromicrobium lacuslunae]|uniref:Zinc finger CGNR domain-containing protein n=1 Tax=Psychromicrobium lacuslunae TaxID=1618207 RepID=A0A0D4BVP4_9MICC|nr:CGNR zinc finger domain-containing protein [Psychromicrobium lacuslunae]AJT40388.1 hypothetical protein UM93_00345 [Psychromicrobium lacuslunae]
MAVDSFRFDGGKTWLDLFSTLGRRYSSEPEERLLSAEALSGWLIAMELSPREAATERDVFLARGLREALRNCTAALLNREPFAEQDDRFIREMLSYREHRTLSAALTLEHFSSPQAVFAEFAEQAIIAWQHPENLSLCAEPDCRRAFRDPSGRRRWCPTPACASRGRVRAFRQNQPQEAHHD